MGLRLADRLAPVDPVARRGGAGAGRRPARPRQDRPRSRTLLGGGPGGRCGGGARRPRAGPVHRGRLLPGGPGGPGAGASPPGAGWNAWCWRPRRPVCGAGPAPQRRRCWWCSGPWPVSASTSCPGARTATCCGAGQCRASTPPGSGRRWRPATTTCTTRPASLSLGSTPHRGLPASGCRSSVVVPARDQLVPPSRQRATAALIPGAAVVEIAGARHEALFTHAPELAAAILGFLSRPPAPARDA